MDLLSRKKKEKDLDTWEPKNENKKIIPKCQTNSIDGYYLAPQAIIVASSLARV
jgi:hypothetical protein